MLLLGLEPATVWSWVSQCNHWALPAPHDPDLEHSNPIFLQDTQDYDDVPSKYVWWLLVNSDVSCTAWLRSQNYLQISLEIIHNIQIIPHNSSWILKSHQVHTAASGWITLQHQFKYQSHLGTFCLYHTTMHHVTLLHGKPHTSRMCF